MTERTVTLVPSIERIQKWLKDIVDDPEMRHKLLVRGTLELADRARAYPPEGPWNRPPGTNNDNRWYQRNFGTRYKVYGKGTRRYAGGATHGKNTSQKLQKNWKVEIESDDFSADVYTPVTYAPYLFDPELRVSWAAEHGWKTIDEIADDYAPRFEELAGEMIDEQIDKPI